ncbi:MAG: Mov34/MPN/PAD-1 family protein [Tannerella sp.]|jgi:hypothetical protein|nr:Mov34/MPN/PAD-1 family protein [Tannerella sp.]
MDKITVVFSNKAYNAIISESFAKHPLETGGILLGYLLDNGIWVVMEVIPPGKNSIFQSAYFEYDTEFVDYVANSVSSQYKTELNLLGLWHRHPGSMDVFSSMDDTTNREYALLNQAGAISGLVNIDPVFRLTMYHVSLPFSYQKMEVAVGDDLIPPDFFNLKYYPEQGINPSLPEKAMKKQKIKRQSVIGYLKKIFDRNRKDGADNANVQAVNNASASIAWFEKNREKADSELNSLIRKYTYVQKNVENGHLVLSVKYGEWMLNMIYPKNYDEDMNEFRVYISNPQITRLCCDYRLPYIATDTDGKTYLTVSEILENSQINGLNVMDVSIKWLNKYNALKNNQITVDEFII